MARNPILFDAFHKLGITEKIGSGINRMRDAMAARNIEIEFDTGDFFEGVGSCFLPSGMGFR